MKYFDEFVSNTLAGSSTQSFFDADENGVMTGRAFYKIFTGGTFNYSLLFSNITDSTFSDGSHSYRNMVIDEWEIVFILLCVAESVKYLSVVDKFFRLKRFGVICSHIVPFYQVSCTSLSDIIYFLISPRSITIS